MVTSKVANLTALVSIEIINKIEMIMQRNKTTILKVLHYICIFISKLHILDSIGSHHEL